MAAKLIVLPAIAVFIGLAQLAFPHLSRSATLMGFRRDNAFFTSPAYTDTLDPLCALQHADKFLGCEDMHLVEIGDRTMIFATCLGDYANRQRVLSSDRDAHTARLRAGAQVAGDKIFRWDVDTDEVVELELVGFPGGGGGGAADRSFHGMDVNHFRDGSMTLYVINHRANGSVVEKFSHHPKLRALDHIATFPAAAHGVRHPNDIYAVPHLDYLSAFFLTDDHRHAAGPLRVVEDYARRPWSRVHYHSTAAGWKLAMDGVAGANGIAGNKMLPSQVYVSALLDGELIVANEDPLAPGSLVEQQRIPLGFMPDNPSLTVSGASLFVAGHPAPQRLARHFADPAKHKGGSMVARISTRQLGSTFFGEKGGYTGTPMVEEVLVDVDGRWITASTTAVFRERNRGTGDLYVTGLTSHGILKCKNMK